MPPSHLRPCLGCSRHVRVSESTCPFCRQSLGAAFADGAAPVPPAVRLSRAALFAFGTGTAAAAAACGGSTVPTAADAAAGLVVDAAYGAPYVPDDASVIAPPYGISPPMTDGGVVTLPPYGISPPPPDEDAGEPSDAEADVRIAPPYGLPPPGH